MSIKHRIGVAIVAASALFAPLQSSHAEGVRAMIDGIGAAKCSQISADIKTQPSAVVNSLLGWAYGYMTRRNVERAIAGQVQVDLTANAFDEKQLLGIVLGFCEKEPDTRVYQVVDALFEVLLQKGSLTS